jgi:hypothetical protein
MTAHPSLFDPPAAAAARADGIQRADDNADDDWKETALDGIRILARRDRFTADDVLEWLERCEVGTHNLAALGPVMQRAARAGWIRSTKTYVPTRIPRRHRDVLVWEGLL